MAINYLALAALFDGENAFAIPFVLHTFVKFQQARIDECVCLGVCTRFLLLLWMHVISDYPSFSSGAAVSTLLLSYCV